MCGLCGFSDGGYGRMVRRWCLGAAGVFLVAVLVVLWWRIPQADGEIRRVPRSRDSIALTFDDGPDPRHTPEILDVLAEYDAHATFFVVGSNAAACPDLVARMIAEGHEVAHHSQTHARMDELTPEEVEREVDDCLAVLAGYGITPAWYRPPRGALTEDQTRMASTRGMRVALWTRTLERARFGSAEEAAHTLVRETRPGDIVLAHDGPGDRSMTVKAMPVYLEGMRDRGISVLTLSELNALENR